MDQSGEEVAAVDGEAWRAVVADAAPTRDDDTTVIAGRRVTLAEALEYVAEDERRRAAAGGRPARS
ncbi:hypothetical protein HC251_00175 [Iamia sp. SCSIO 61187]|uniref:hypothetical protein n=1 Tax=Iamia sp. SCSIO 61187 TaxID=2722752 RepID=UPI001C638335|nr:hypothetical protein [Iamia sp. SCSIO 61187]QYG91001.1 hypothetical protein HC251_00175 [Iamia sp. SCSIO 61187]